MNWYRTMHEPGWCCVPSSCGRRTPTTTPSAPGPTCGRFYALVRLTYGEPSNPAKAAESQARWWRVHREIQHEPGSTPDELVDSLTRLDRYLFGEPEERVRPAAVHRTTAMGLADQWVEQGCQPDSPLLPRACRPGPRLRS